MGVLLSNESEGDRLPKRIPLLPAAGALALTTVICLLWWLWPVMPDFAEVRARATTSETVLLDRNGHIIQEMRVDPQSRRLAWTPIEQISPALQDAVIEAEDRRFFGHGGVDWRSFAAAVPSYFRLSASRGASTITMQLAAKIRPELEPRSGRRTLLQKVRQVLAAWSLERRWSKQQILEAYLNLVTYRGELLGIRAASRGLFGKAPHGIDSTEASLLAVLLRAPGADAATVAGRATRLAAALGQNPDPQAIARLARSALERPYVIRPTAELAPHAARRLARQGAASGTLESTIDGSLQEFVLGSLGRHLASVRERNVHDGAVLVIDNLSSEVLAYVGNQGDGSEARHVDGVQALRQAGSTLKPFIYAKAFQERLLTPSSLLDDSPLDLPVVGGVYRPRNYDRRFLGPVSVRIALASSLNVPAVRVLGLIGGDSAVGILAAMGFRALRSADYYGPSLALGSVDVALWDLTGAYHALANGGEWTPLRLEPGGAAGERRRVFSAQAAWLVSQILSDRESRNRTFSLESPLSTRFWSAVKTGTSKDMRDNWCVGYSDRFTVGVWAGNFRGEPMWDVSGLTGAAPVWVEIMNRLHRESASVAPEPPPGIVTTASERADGSTRTEYYMAGTEETSTQQTADFAPPRITYPAAGTVIALDPDIPEGQQQLFFEATPRSKAFRWVLDGRPIGSAEELRYWVPEMGKHRLELTGPDGRSLDEGEFEVRGHSGRADDPPTKAPPQSHRKSQDM